jgi:hypothetical protein
MSLSMASHNNPTSQGKCRQQTQLRTYESDKQTVICPEGFSLGSFGLI